jgi:hypothetical protein
MDCTATDPPGCAGEEKVSSVGREALRAKSVGRNQGDCRKSRTTTFPLVLALLSVLTFRGIADAQACNQGWCNTFPVEGVQAKPPFGSSAWNKLVYVPDDGRFYIYSSDGIFTFSNSWWSYSVLGHTATTNPWQEESTSGTTQRAVTDNSKGFLKSGIGSTETTISLRVGEGSSFHPGPKAGGILVIDDEEIAYSSASLTKDTFTNVTRGVRGTTPAYHAAGAIVNGGAPAPQSRIQGKLMEVNDHIPDRHPFLTAAYDSKRHQLLQAGGIIENNKKNDTWYFCLVPNEYCPPENVRVWRRLLTKTPVPSRADSAMTYDPDDDVMILYGGQSFGNPTSDTWLLCFRADPQISGNSVGCPAGRPYPDWVQVAAKGVPDPRFAHSIVYDAAHHLVVLFGGVNGKLPDPSDTWTYSPGSRTWTNAKPAGQNPASFRRPAMTYDSTRDRVVLYEGPPEKSADGAQGGLFIYDAGANRWEKTAVSGGPIPSSPGPEHAHGRLSIGYDSKTDTFVATELGPGYTLQTWELRGSALKARKTGEGSR